MEVKAFITHKLDERYADCADSFAVNTDCKRIAVSDGVSQSFSPQDWAKLLVNAFSDKAYTPNEDDEQLANLQHIWRKIVLQNLKKLEDAGEVTWMMENCIEDKESAGATFCGVELQGDQFCLWVLGDSALVTVSDNLEYKLYSTQDGEFNNRPDFLDSYGAHVGVFRKYDIPKKNLAYILLVTDPFSDLLHQCNNNQTAKEILERLLNVQSHDEFCVVVDDLRENYSMHNDDSTFVSIKVDDSDDFQVLVSTDIEALIKDEAQNQAGEVSSEPANNQPGEEFEPEAKSFNVSAIIKGSAEKNKKQQVPPSTPETPQIEDNETVETEFVQAETEEALPETEHVQIEAEETQNETEVSLEEAEADQEEGQSEEEPVQEKQETVQGEQELAGDFQEALTYEEFLASSKEVYDEMCDYIESKPFYMRIGQKLAPNEFEEFWIAIADKLYKK